jgi:hypothetical protein
MAHVADPLYESAFGLDQLERVRAISWNGHDDGDLMGLVGSFWRGG